MQQQLDTVSRREICCLFADNLELAAERIDPSEYREVALALLALDVPVGQVKRLALAIAVVRGEECFRHFMGEYADLVWETIREDLNKRRSD